MNTAEKEILDVVCFFKLFNHQVSPEEMDLYLPKTVGGKSDEISYSVPVSANSKKNNFFIPLLQLVPFIRMACICNTKALGVADDRSDIDLFIITNKQRIFTARVLSSFFFHILGVRRHGNKIRGRFCLSFFITEDSMNLKPIKISNDIYLRFWLTSLIPVFGQPVFNEFIRKNDWFYSKFNHRRNKVKKYTFLKMIQYVFEFFLNGIIGEKIERKLEKWHLKRFELKKKNLSDDASVIVNEKMLKFHNHDKRAELSEKFFKLRNSLSL